MKSFLFSPEFCTPIDSLVLRSDMKIIVQYFQHPYSFINNSKFVFQVFPKIMFFV